MSISLQTNVNSLISQENLRVNNNFQSQTIERLTSGYRINKSGDDAAGLAVANMYRSNSTELTQGVRNANDGISQLQTMDSGMGNISSMLDRLKTLATESSSGTFTGDRATLDDEFKSLLSEIDRQAQAIGLNDGGTFAKSLSVYIGGGDGTSDTAVKQNSTVTVDLSAATVDTRSLGLEGVQVVNSGSTYNLGSATAGVEAIVNDAANIAGETGGKTQFTFNGSGFGAGVTINVDLSGVTDTGKLADAINTAIVSQETSNASFQSAGIKASVVTGADGSKKLAFTSSTSAFQVTANDLMSNALIGNTAVAGGTTGSATNYSAIAGGSYQVSGNLGYTALAVSSSQDLTFTVADSSGTVHSATVHVANASATLTLTEADAITQINSQLQATKDSELQKITAVATGAGSLNFIGVDAFSVSVAAQAGATGVNGGTATTKSATEVGTGSSLDISTQEGAEAAITAISKGVQKLGLAQGAVGKGENVLSYAIDLASSQITNFNSAESQIRDADVASEAANLSQAKIMQQANVAAMAQANSAPEAVLSLLKG
jgi:flagellin